MQPSWSKFSTQIPPFLFLEGVEKIHHNTFKQLFIQYNKEQQWVNAKYAKQKVQHF
jgi:hypothetical protein